MEKSWQDVLDRFHYGIYLVTIAADGLYNGMIASWAAQCSHTPPLITLAIRKNRLSQSQIMQAGKFTFNILPKDALPLLNKFKVPDWKHKFDGIEYELSPSGNPVLKGALGYHRLRGGAGHRYWRSYPVHRPCNQRGLQEGRGCTHHGPVPGAISGG